jgi:hypothetical protein
MYFRSIDLSIPKIVIRDQLKEHKTRNDSSGPQDLLHMYIDLSDKMRENEAFSGK